MDSRQTQINRYKLILLLGIPFLMMAGAFLVYFTGIGIPTSTSNKGVLIDPPLRIGSLASLQPQTFPAADNNHWFIIIPGGADCSADCHQRLHLTRQIRIALGKYTHRVQRVYLNLSANEPDAALHRFLAGEHPDLQVVSAARQDFTRLVETALIPPGNIEQVFYVADPRGFIMLYYNDEHSGKDVLADMKFLLKFSQE